MNDSLYEDDIPVRQSGLATPDEWENWNGRDTIVRRMPSSGDDDFGVNGRKSLNLWQAGDPEVPVQQPGGPVVDGSEGESASRESEDDGHYRTNALGRDDVDDIAKFRAMMGITVPPAAAKSQPTAVRPLPKLIDDSSDSDSDDVSDTESAQTRDSLPFRGGLDINAGLGPRAAQARPGAMNVGRYFSTFGARRKQAGFFGALFGRGGARAEAAAQADAARALKQARKAQATEARWDTFRNLKTADNTYVKGLSKNRSSQDYSQDDLSRWNSVGDKDESLNPFTRMAASSKAVLAAAEADTPKYVTVSRAKQLMARQRRAAQ